MFIELENPGVKFISVIFLTTLWRSLRHEISGTESFFLFQIVASFSDVVLETFKENNTDLTGEKGFKPHITIMKLSRAPRLRKAGQLKQPGKKDS